LLEPIEPETIPSKPLDVLGLSLHEELVCLVLQPSQLCELLPLHQRVDHSLFGDKEHLLIEGLSLNLLVLDVLMNTDHHLSLGGELCSVPELRNDVLGPYSSCCPLLEPVEASLKALVVPHDHGGFLENPLSFELV